jgi:hypothetical protein
MNEYGAKFILYMLGWREFQINKDLPKRFLVISQNTSKWDLILLVLHKYAYPEYFKNHILITNNELMNQLPKKIKMYSDEIIESAYENADIIDEKYEDKDKIIMTPFYGDKYSDRFIKIAKKLNLPIVVSGLDYEDKRLKIFEPINFDFENEIEGDIIREIKNRLKNIIPLNIDYIKLEWRNHNKNEISVTNNQIGIILLIAFILIIIYYSYRYNIMSYMIENKDKIKNMIL